MFTLIPKRNDRRSLEIGRGFLWTRCGSELILTFDFKLRPDDKVADPPAVVS